ncbi:MAG TPA: hypothetical protein VKQ05_09430 [Gemmatimonadales bacterium]|nr:hypothetical protein [Gemmatimonadales bacterium]
MTSTSLWRRIAIALAVFNVAGAGFAIAAGEGWHAGIHVSLALAFAFAARRLQQAYVAREAGSVQQQLEEHAAALQEMQDALTRQSGQIAELQERVDFAERMLAQARDRQQLEARRPKDS